jgi:glutaconyl-CoA/methylmalonyl-CoA decarboxylase subunit gamma
VKLVLVLDGERREVEVDLARQVVRIGAHDWPVRVGPSGNGSASFEILGERVEVRSDGSGDGTPTTSIIVNGEVHSLRVESRVGASASSGPSPAPSNAPGPSRGSGSAPEEGPGRALFPPMPGKVLEVRVQNGEKVHAGQVLLVVEAMKMRNEVTAPIAGEVSDLRVSAGANVAARDVLLRILPA